MFCQECRRLCHTKKLAGVIVAAILAIAGCSLASRTRAADVQFHGEATDPIGDTAPITDVRVARPADLVYARVQVTNDAVRFTVRFAPGSLDPATTGAVFDLDTDLDTATGAPHPGLGADYSVSLHAGPRQATVARAVTDAGCEHPCRYEPFEHAAVVLSGDEMEAVVPRSAFARFDGRLNFLVIAYAIFDRGRQTATSDHMPNLPAHFIAVR